MAKATQKKLPNKGAKQETPVQSGIVPTEDSWINVTESGKAVFVNIAEADLILTEYNGQKRVTLITSMKALENIVSGEKHGIKLSRFKD
jgi:hypothetical protein